MFFFFKLFSRGYEYCKKLIVQIYSRLNHHKYRAKLTVLPGIGMKNAQRFFDAGYRTPKQILDASDEALLSVPGVGRDFLKRLRQYNE